MPDRTATSDSTAPLSAISAASSLGPDREHGNSGMYEGVVEKEEYSVFTVGQKKAIIVTASFAAWFRCVAKPSNGNGTTDDHQSLVRHNLLPSYDGDIERSGSVYLEDQYHRDNIFGSLNALTASP